jgi:hypothetical protein
MRSDFRPLIPVRAAQQNFNSRAEVLGIDGFDQIIVRAGIEYLHAMGNLCPVSQHHQRHFDMALAKLRADIHRVQARLGMIDDDQVKAVSQAGIGTEFQP